MQVVCNELSFTNATMSSRKQFNALMYEFGCFSVVCIYYYNLLNNFNKTIKCPCFSVAQLP